MTLNTALKCVYDICQSAEQHFWNKKLCQLNYLQYNNIQALVCWVSFLIGFDKQKFDVVLLWMKSVTDLPSKTVEVLKITFNALEIVTQVSLRPEL